ncbi:MAG TPA: cyclic nucleotide-binding domain-containing protein [Ktedonobacteraceae bacterium]|nr:cyclic nucleotide-binding domain-containing protein [Ktedonobacteraceae bacterium]
MQSTTPVPDPALPGLRHRAGIKPLNAKQIRFEIDMCIGCDRCMLSCPVPLSSSITIADLNAATISEAASLAPQIASFTQECVMCGSCVPVCPVGNHRDLLMLSLKQRLGTSWNGPVDLARVQNSLPAGLSPSSLLAALRQQPLFRDPQVVPDAYLLHLMAESSVQPCNAGHILFREGDFGRDIYFILDGQIELSSTDASGTALPFALHSRGEDVGDYGMLTGQPHYATAMVRSPNGALLLIVREQTMQRMMELVPAMRHYFEQRSNAQSLAALLKRLPLFQGLPDDAIRWLAQQTRTRRYERDERLFAEDERGEEDMAAREALHIVLEGFVKVSRRTAMGTGRNKGDERVIAYRRHGDYFAGGLDMLGDRQAVTVTAITRVRVAEVPRQALSTLFNAFPIVAQRFQERLQEYREAVDAAQTAMFAAVDPRRMPVVNPRSDAEARRGLHSLVSEGVVEGTDVLVIDLDRCIHCGECEEACARRHGHSRMNRKGMVVGNMTIATACRQCQDPVCMLCSRGGIARMPGGEVYITESCIGCGICAERCPYDNISIISLEETHKETLSTWQRFNALLKHGFGKEAGRKSLPILPVGTLPAPLEVESGYTEMLKKVAIKCDLCAGYENQACVQACPSGAAFRVNPVRFFGSTEGILRQRAQ